MKKYKKYTNPLIGVGLGIRLAGHTWFRNQMCHTFLIIEIINYSKLFGIYFSSELLYYYNIKVFDI